MPEDLLRLHLLPEGEASVTPQGLSFKGLLYVAEKGDRQDWHERARLWKRWKVPIAWDPNDRGVLHLRPDGTRVIERWVLSPRSEGYVGFSHIEYEIDQSKRERERARRRGESEIQSAQLKHDLERTLEAARQRTELLQVPGRTVSAQVRDIREKRAREVQAERDANRWGDIGDSSSEPKETEIPPGQPIVEGRSPSRRLAEYWKSLEEEG